MSQWYFPQRSSLIHSEDPYLSVYSGVVRMKDGNVISHYGVKGMHWGEITKEYEPVAVDHRKLKTAQLQTPNYRISTKPRMSSAARQKAAQTMSRKQVRAMRRREREGYYTKDANGRTVWRQNGREYSPSEQRQKIVRRALIAAGVATAVLAAYGAVKYRHIQKTKAYSGILNRFLNQNPGANLSTESGRQLYQKGLNLAKTNSASRASIKRTNRYLKQKGLSLKKKEAVKIYKQNRNIDKLLRTSYKKSRVRNFLKRNGLLTTINIGGA